MGKVIVLSPGHGLDETGRYQRPLMDCRGPKVKVVPGHMTPDPDDFLPGFYREDTGVLYLAYDIAEKLEEYGHTVYLTRDNEDNAKLFLSRGIKDVWKLAKWPKYRWITNFTNNLSADIFIEIHTNAGGGSGCVSFWRDAPNGVTLSDTIATYLRLIGIRTKKVTRKQFSVLNNCCNGRSILLEVLFHDNIDDIQWLLTPEKQLILANTIADAINNYSESF